MSKESPATLAAARYEESGLTPKDAKALGLEVLSAISTAALGFDKRPAIKIPYPDPRAKGKALRGHPGYSDFYRIRYLGTPPAGFADSTKGKAPRYTQPPSSGVCAYFPALADWGAILDDASKPIIITEGEFKAAKACKEGYPAIGLGGVYSFRSANQGVDFLPELEAVNWVTRTVYIIYDSDMHNNQMVCRAINALAEELLERGATTMLVDLPDLLDGAKTGLDDYLVHEDPDSLAALMHTQAQHLTQARKLWQLNEDHVYVKIPDIVINTRDSSKLQVASFVGHGEYSTKSFTERVVKDDGTISTKKVPLAKAWMEWPLREMARNMTYAPGAGQFVNGQAWKDYNIWAGWGCAPKKGNVKPWTELVDHLFQDAAAEDREWFERWCAYPIQFPGTKLFTAVVMHGNVQGTGKSLVGYTLGKIYGVNFTEISQDDLHGSFNEWAEAKQFVMGDDVTGSDYRADADKLKKMITQRELRINAKYMKPYTIPDCVNYFFNSNQPTAFFLEDLDRRYFVQEVEVDPLPATFYDSFIKWRDEEGGAEALFHHLLHLDLGDFNPSAAALTTDSKRRMIIGGKSDLAGWVLSLKEDTDNVLRLGQVPLTGDLFTSTTLLALYDPEGTSKSKTKAMGNELKRAGYRQVYGGHSFRGPADFKKERYWAIRNVGRWKKASLEDIREHLEEQTSKKKKKF